MLTIHDLLEDPVYKKYFCSPPPKKSLASKPWRVYLQLKPEKNWTYKDFTSYVEAFKFFKHHLKQGHVMDGAIASRGLSFAPPFRTVRVKGKYHTNSKGERQQVTARVSWKPKLDLMDLGDYRWCVYCRRPTEFKYFTKHRVLNAMSKIGLAPDPSVKRCYICGTSERVNTHG